MTRTSDANPVVSVHFATIEDVKDKLKGIVNAEVVDRRLGHNVADQLSIALFAQRAFLVEGTTELSVFYGIGDRKSHGSLEAAGISIVPVGSKTSIPLAHAILSTIGVPVFALFDADAGFEARAKAKNKMQELSMPSGIITQWRIEVCLDTLVCPKRIFQLQQLLMILLYLRIILNLFV